MVYLIKSCDILSKHLFWDRRLLLGLCYPQQPAWLRIGVPEKPGLVA
jgi:hypothetical protein